MSGAARMIRNIMTLGIWTLVSRGAGLARDLMMANYLGAGAVADAFNVAFSLPNMFRRFFAEGAFNQAFVPIYAKKLEAGEDAEGFAQDAFAGLSAILLALVLIVQVFSHFWLHDTLGPGLGGGGGGPRGVLPPSGGGAVLWSTDIYETLAAWFLRLSREHRGFAFKTDLTSVIQDIFQTEAA
jgi:hypothetical protein